MQLILGRHGKAAHNLTFEQHEKGDRKLLHGARKTPGEDGPLVEAGIRQARAAGAYLKERGISPDVAYISPSVRTRQTWEGYGFPDLTPMVDLRLREQEGGVFDRLPLAATEEQRKQYTVEVKHSPEARPPGGESVREHLERVQAWLQEVATRLPASTVVAVAHYGCIGLLGMLCEGMTVEQYLGQRPPHLVPGYGDLIGYRRDSSGWERVFVFRNPCIDPHTG